MEILALTAIVVIVIYATVSIARFGIPPSISDTHYLWAESSRTMFGKHVFTFTLWAVSFLILPFLLSTSTTNTQWLAFISCGALAFVGTACEFQERLTHTVHYASAYTWASATLLWVIINISPAPVIAGLAIAFLGLIAQSLSNRTFWLEIGCIIALAASIIIKICE